MASRNRMGQKLIGYISVVLSSIALVLAITESPTAATADPQTYKITFELRFRKLGEATFPTKANVSATDLNIASGGANSTAATLAASVDTGFKYDKAQATLTCTVKLKGSVTDSGTTYYTTSSGAVSTSAGDLAEGSYSFSPDPCSGASSVTFESPVFTPALDIGGTLNFTFNVAGALQLNFTPGAQLSAAPFSASMTTGP